MENIKRYRAIASTCRQQAALHPEASWQWLADAERYEHLADAEITAHFMECNGSRSSSVVKITGIAHQRADDP